MPTISTIDDVSNIRSIAAAVTANAGAIAIQNIAGVLKQVDDQGNVTSLGGGGGLTPIADQDILGNVSGASAVPIGLTPTQVRTALSIQASSAVAITGGTITGTTIALAPAQLSDGPISVTGSTGVLTNPTLTGLTATAGTLKNDVLTGKAGGQVWTGGTAASDPLTLLSTSNGTRGLIKLGDGTASTFSFNEATGATSITQTGGSTALTLTSSNNTDHRILIINSTGGTQQSSNFQLRAGTADFFVGLNSSTFTGTPGLFSQTVSGASGNWLFQMHQATGDFLWQTTTSDTTMMTLTNAGVLTMGASATIQLAAGTLAANNTVATVLGSLGPTGAHTTVQEWMLVKGTSGASRWIPMF